MLGNPDIATLGNAMRTKRNLDMYAGGAVISEKEAQDYLAFVRETIAAIRAATVRE